MFHVRPLPDPGSPQPHRVLAPRAGVVIRARLLSPLPVVLSTHYDPVIERTVPHLDNWCPGCDAARPLAIRGLGYCCAAVHQRLQVDGHVSDSESWSRLVCLCLPEGMVWQLRQLADAGRDWRGVVVDVWHADARPRSPLVCRMVERLDPQGWPRAWDVLQDLRALWAEYLARAGVTGNPFAGEEGEVA